MEERSEEASSVCPSHLSRETPSWAPLLTEWPQRSPEWGQGQTVAQQQHLPETIEPNPVTGDRLSPGSLAVFLMALGCSTCSYNLQPTGLLDPPSSREGRTSPGAVQCLERETPYNLMTSQLASELPSHHLP